MSHPPLDSAAEQMLQALASILREIARTAVVQSPSAAPHPGLDLGPSDGDGQAPITPDASSSPSMFPPLER